MSVAIPPDPDFTAFARNRDEAAFHRLVKAHLGMVRRTALRTLYHHPHLSDDVAQAVFLRLAKKASALPPDLCLPMWLHQQAVWIARNTERTETRRRAREKTAHLMNEEAADDDHAPPPLAPLMDTALLALPPRDREAILLRYFQNLNFHHPSLFERWVLKDGPGAMTASLSPWSVRLAGSGYDHYLSRLTYDSWVKNHFDEAQQWLFENQKNSAWDDHLPWMVGLIAQGYAARDPNQFVAWALQIQGDDLRESAIISAVRVIEDKDTDSKQDGYRELFDLLKAQENPAFVHNALAIFLRQSAGEHGLETEMAREVALLPRSTDLLWELMKSNTGRTLKGMGEARPPAQVEAMVSDMLRARNHTEYADLKMFDARLNPEQLAPYLTGPDREDLLGHMAALTGQAGARDEGSSWEALLWTAQIADESRRTELTREILKALPQDKIGPITERMKEKPLHSLPPHMRSMVEAAAGTSH